MFGKWPSVLFGEIGTHTTYIIIAFVLVSILLTLKRSFKAGVRARIKLAIKSFIIYGVLLVAASIFKAADSTTGYYVTHALSLFVLAFTFIESCLILIFNSYLARKEYVVPSIVRDLISAILYGATIIVLLARSGVNLISLLTTSAVLTAVIGLALQDTLMNLIAGLTLQFENTLAIGDWIEINGQQGVLREIGWRTCRFETRDATYIVIPNNLINKTSLINISQPTGKSRVTFELGVHFNVPPNEVKKVLMEAVLQIEDVLHEPAPQIIIYRFAETRIIYYIRFFISVITSYDRLDRVKSDVMTMTWYALRRKDIKFPFPMQDLYVHQITREEEQQEKFAQLQERIEKLKRVDFLSPLSEKELETLAEGLRVDRFARGEEIITEGSVEYTFYYIVEGVVNITIGVDKDQIASLKAGEFFGEMSLMTGEPRSATVTAATDVICYIVDKSSFKELFIHNDTIAQEISTILSQRQQQLKLISKKAEEERSEHVEKEANTALLGRIKAFFNLK